MGTSSATCYVPTTVSAGSDLKFSFSKTYVAHTFTVADGDSVTTDVVDFLKDILIEGDWAVLNGKSSSSTNYGYVLTCTNLDGSAKCDVVENEDVAITVNDNINTLQVTEIITSPNNLRNDAPAYYSDFKVTFSLGEGMPTYGSYAKIQLDIPGAYVLH